MSLEFLLGDFNKCQYLEDSMSDKINEGEDAKTFIEDRIKEKKDKQLKKKQAQLDRLQKEIKELTK